MDIQQLQKIRSKSVTVRLTAFLLCLLLVWLPFAIPIDLLLKTNTNLATIATMGLLFIFFIILQKLWGKYIYQNIDIFQQYGLKSNKLSLIILVKGLAIGFLCCCSLFFIEAIVGWIEIHNSADFFLKIVLEGLLSALGIALAEELVFRGWVLYELEQDYSKTNALWVSSILFAVAHFLKPVAEIMRTAITFPALLLLGLTLVWAKRGNKNNLTICIGIHAGLVWGYYILNVGNLISYTDKVPDWITGIDGNPIAGILGLSFLLILALVMRKKAIGYL